MKKLVGILMYGVMCIAAPLNAQKIDDVRMERDIEVAENVLKTLLRQQFDKQRMFFGLEVEGSYQQGFGVTFRFPADFTTPIAFNFSGDIGEVLYMDGQSPNSFSYSFSNPNRNEQINVEMEEKAARVEAEAARIEADKVRLKENVGAKIINADSLRDAYNQKVILAAKDFMIDYGDLISQLEPNEKIVITNRGDQPRVWVNQFFSSPKRSHLSMEITKADITAHKQGKLTRDQAIKKISVVNTEAVDVVEPDLELLSSIFNRLYRQDLSTTFFTDEGVYYERLKDFGAIYYMRVFSSNQNRNYNTYNMPTVNLRDVDQETRDKKVKEIYPAFEKDLKENVIEYGRTLKSLGDNESLVFNVRLTKCGGCGIPSSIELTVKGSVLKDYSAGKISKDSALGKVSVKKGQNQ